MVNTAPAPSPEELAATIAGPARYKFDELIQGIGLKQRRLGAAPHLVVLWQQVLDYDGLTDWLFLGEAFGDIPSASAEADRWLQDIQRETESAVLPAGRQGWQVDATRSGRFVAKIRAEAVIQPQAERTLTLSGGPFDRVYFCARVLGKFPGPCIGHELFDALSDSRHELWSYFVDVGETHRAQRIRRTPTSIVTR